MNQQDFIKLISAGRHEWQWRDRAKYKGMTAKHDRLLMHGYSKGTSLDLMIGDYAKMDNQTHVCYVSPNAVDELRALGMVCQYAGEELGKITGKETPKDDAYKVFMKALNHSHQNRWADIDVDTKNEAIVDRVRSALNHQGYVEICTRGGYHFLIELSKNPSDNWYQKVREIRRDYLGQFEVEPKKDQAFFVPMPYTVQGGTLVTITDVTL